MELTACRHPVHDEQTNFQNVTEISFLPSSFWYFIVTVNCLLLGAHVLIVMGALQIYIDDDYDDDDDGNAISALEWRRWLYSYKNVICTSGFPLPWILDLT